MWPGHTGPELLLRTVSFPVGLGWRSVLIVTMATQAPASHPRSRKRSKQRRKSKQRYVAMELICFYFEERGFLQSPTCGLHHRTCLYSKAWERRAITRLLWTRIALLGKKGIKVTGELAESGPKSSMTGSWHSVSVGSECVDSTND